jgi:Tol biopolymer transport system component/DNA-binding winged helix-turn-helix (wHTH) protein
VPTHEPLEPLIYEFGLFRLDPVLRSLTRDGSPVKLPPRAIEVLVTLVAAENACMTREAILTMVWGDIHVELGSVDQQIFVLRRALGLIEPGTIFIEHVAGRGYRLAIEVTAYPRPHAQVSNAAPGAAPETALTWRRWGLAKYATSIIVLVVGAAGALTWFTAEEHSPEVMEYQQLTYDRKPKYLSSPLLTGGGQVYYREELGVTFHAIGADGGEPRAVLGASSEFVLTDVRPTGREYLALKGVALDKPEGELWVLPGSGVPRKVGYLVGREAAWSVDGKQIAYIRGPDLYVAKNDGTAARKLPTPSHGYASIPRWSPHGDVIRFTFLAAFDRPVADTSLWEVRADGGNLHRLLEGWNEPPSECCGNWSPKGDFFVFQAVRDGTRSLWMLPERGRFRGAPVKLTRETLSWSSPVVSPDGRTVYAIGVQDAGELVQFNIARREFVPYLPGVSGVWITYSPDREWIAYVGHSDKKLWRSRPDGTDKRVLDPGPFDIDGATWSPDGKWIAYRSRRGGRHVKIHLIPAEGGEPHAIAADDRAQGVPSWSPDGKRIVYGDAPPVFQQPEGGEALYIYDLANRTSFEVPGSQAQRVWSSRWSPDGRYLSALTIQGQKLRLYEFATGKWRSLSADHIENPVWSSDSAFIYYNTEGIGFFLRRVGISDGHVKTLADLRDYPLAPPWWSGLTLDNQPVVLRNLGAPEVFALRLDLPSRE